MEKTFSFFVILVVSLNLYAQGDLEEAQNLRERQKFWLGMAVGSGICLVVGIVSAIGTQIEKHELETEISNCEAEKKKISADLFKQNEADLKANANAESQKTCPYCAEPIKKEAIVCRYCGRDLTKESFIKNVNKTPKDSLIIEEQDIPEMEMK